MGKKKLTKKQQEHAQLREERRTEQATTSTPAIALGKVWSSLTSNDTNQIALHPTVHDIIVNQFKFSHMSPVQENSIPLLLSRTNALVQACTGSGKTLAYLTPLFHHILKFKETAPQHWKDNYIYGLVICPTRELAKQVYSVANIFAKHQDCPVTVQLITGGDDMEVESLAGHIAVCTPGRLLDILTSTLIFPHDWLQMIVLDEADRLLDLGFSNQLEQIIKILKRKRRSAFGGTDPNSKLVHGLFSATMSECLMNDLVKTVGLDKKENSIVSVQVDVQQSSKQATPVELTNYFIVCEQDERLAVLCGLLQKQCSEQSLGSNGKVIVYFLTCACVDYYLKLLQELLLKDGIPNMSSECSFQICGLHGQMVTKRRKLTYESFMSEPENIADKKSLQVMLCTDVAARGLDLPNVELIIQYDAPTDPSSFVHRVGRTARMGKTGQSIVLLSKHEDNYVEYLHVKRVPVIPYTSSEDHINQEYKNNVFTKMKQIALKDKEILEKGSQAFVTFVRAYREHQCEYIFRVRQLNFASLARAYVLTQLPKKMRELKKILPAHLVAAVKGVNPDAEKKKKKNQRRKTTKEKKEEQRKIEEIKFTWDKDLCSADIEKVPYRDSRKEKARKIREEKESQQNDKDNGSDDEVEKEEKKKSVSQQKREIRDSKDINVKRKRAMYEQLEMNELEREAKLLKLLKAGKISREKFEAMTGEDELEAMIMAETHTKNSNSFVSSIEQKKQGTDEVGTNNGNNNKKNKNKKRRK